MTDYELLLAVSEKEPEENQKKLVKEIESQIEKHKGSLSSTDNWGKRALAFSIDGQKNAFYWLANFHSGPEGPKVIADTLRINDKVLRFLITKKEAKKIKTREKTKKS